MIWFDLRNAKEVKWLQQFEQQLYRIFRRKKKLKMIFVARAPAQYFFLLLETDSLVACDRSTVAHKKLKSFATVFPFANSISRRRQCCEYKFMPDG